MDTEDPVLLELSRLSQKENYNKKDLKGIEKLYLEEKIKLLRDDHQYLILLQKYTTLKSLSKKIINRYANLLETSLDLTDLNQKIINLKGMCKENFDFYDTQNKKTDNNNTLPEVQSLDNDELMEKEEKIKELEKIIRDLKQENILLQTTNKTQKQDIYQEKKSPKIDSTISFEISLPTILEKMVFPSEINKEEDNDETKVKKIKDYKEDIENNSELYDDKTFNSYDVEDKEYDDGYYSEEGYIDESKEDVGNQRFCEHLMYLFEEMQYIIFKSKEKSDKKYLQMLDVYNAYKKYLSFYISKERLGYIDKLIDEIDENNLEEKNVLDFYYEISDLIFEPYLILD